ncbi:hypothetical protein FA95DRAFT_1359270 [Auriscalpium vulgare]|uniref:Uncharacterized protein n=1 Tax=Auriscalpium vulgare TaxID=40419 RepID=A0ACB8RR37_9AGAM|nr:hypothetical protein FA95DRAFT_1359270 [Auriscalpium vulgare]
MQTRLNQNAAAHQSGGDATGAGMGTRARNQAERNKTTHPRSSRNRQMTFATISSFFSRCPVGVRPFCLVRAACLSVAVAPKHSAKSIVDDCCSHSHTAVDRSDVSKPHWHKGGLDTHVLPPQLLLDDRVRDAPVRHVFRHLHRGLRAVRDELRVGRRWVLEPVRARHLPVPPELVRRAADERERGDARALRELRDLLHEALVLARVPVVQRWVLDDLPAREPHERHGAQQPAREVEVDLVRQAVREDLVQVRRDVRRGRVVRVVVRVPVRRRRRRQRERQRLHVALGRQDQRVLDHRARPRVQVRVLDLLAPRVLEERGHRRVPRLVVLDEVDGRLERLLVHRRRERQRVLEPEQDPDVQELVLRDAHVPQDRLFGGERERGRGGQEVNGCNELVDARVE